jgi:hypothetical protein
MARPFRRRASGASPSVVVDESAGYRLQADAFGGLDKSIQRMLRSHKEQSSAVPFERRAPQTRDGVGLKAAGSRCRWNVRFCEEV